MRKIEANELKVILENHKHWLNEDCDGWENMRADLSNADLSCIDLSYCDLTDADLSNSDISNSNMYCAKLNHANMSNTYLCYTNMSYAELERTLLSKSDLSFVNLKHADLRAADLSYCDLSCANLSYTDLSNTDLSYSDLNQCNLSNTNIYKNTMGNTTNLFVPLACPDSGAFIGWKKAENDLIVKLLIPGDAKRSSGTGRKCRCNKALVVDIQYEDGTKANFKTVRSVYDRAFYYRIGDVVEVDNFCEDRFMECAPGIHFFINRQEAVNYHMS